MSLNKFIYVLNLKNKKLKEPDWLLRLKLQLKKELRKFKLKKEQESELPKKLRG